MSASQHRIYFLLQHAAHRLQKEMDRRLLIAASLTTAQAAVLMVIAGKGQVSQKEIALQLRQTESAMTAMINRLLTNDLVQRTRSPLDGRTWCVALTADGTKALAKARKPVADINGALDEVLDSNQMAELAHHLGAVSEAFDPN